MDGKAGTVERGRNMKGLFIPNITSEMFRNGCLEGIEALMAEGEIYDIECDPSAQRWIPCSERLPEPGVYVLVDGADIPGGYRFPLIDKICDDGEWLNCDGSEWSAVAWMSIPEPWKGERDG